MVIANRMVKLGSIQFIKQLFETLRVVVRIFHIIFMAFHNCDIVWMTEYQCSSGAADLGTIYTKPFVTGH